MINAKEARKVSEGYADKIYQKTYNKVYGDIVDSIKSSQRLGRFDAIITLKDAEFSVVSEIKTELEKLGYKIDIKLNINFIKISW